MPLASSASRVPSVDALSTTSTPSTGWVWPAIPARHSSSSAFRLYVTTTARTESAIVARHHRSPLRRRDVAEPPAPAVAREAQDPRDPVARPIVVEQVLDHELSGSAGGRNRRLSLVLALHPDVVAQPAEVLPEALERRRERGDRQHRVPEPRAAAHVALRPPPIHHHGVGHEPDRTLAAQPQAVL